jgi:hypothetical protein
MPDGWKEFNPDTNILRCRGTQSRIAWDCAGAVRTDCRKVLLDGAVCLLLSLVVLPHIKLGEMATLVLRGGEPGECAGLLARRTTSDARAA